MLALQTAGMNKPLEKSHGIFSDIRFFFLQKPKTPTLIAFADKEAREEYSHRIMQRIGIDVTKYSVLNVHRIGIEAPVSHVFEELLSWDGDSSCWPNYIASVYRLDGRLEHIRIYLFGHRKYPLGFERSFLGLKFIPLFSLNIKKFQHNPVSSDDNARYLLYESRGGYPIGIFTLYVRSPIAKHGESELSQLFFAVGFNFYGKEYRPQITPVNMVWEKVHNRVTSNVLYRFKQLCEWRFRKLQDGQYHKDLL